MRKYLPHLSVLAFFVLVSLAFFYPVLKGKAIFQSDIVQYTGMAKQQNDFRAEQGEETYWTDSAFGGMPTYQLGAKYPYNYIKQLDLILRFLPRPADYLFLYFACFYVLMLVLKIDFRVGILGALAFGFSTYLIIILGVGHNAKAHAIAYMPLVLAATFYLLRKPGLSALLFLSLALALELNANHFQMTYYLILPVAVVFIIKAIQLFKEKAYVSLFKSVGISLAAVCIALLLNATNLMATQEYVNFSTRGTASLTINPDGTPKESTSGLNKDYITEYSYGLAESLNLLVPGLFGGSNSEPLGKDSQLYDFLRKNNVPVSQATSFVKNAPLYWGDQPIVAAPAYLGAVVVFLLFIGFALVESPYKKGLFAAMVFALVLSWGKNFSLLTDLFIDYVPMYDKFRAVSSIQVIIALCAPLLAAWGLHAFISRKHDESYVKKALMYAGGIVGGTVILLLFFKNSLFEFEGVNDAYYAANFGPEFVDALQEDRSALYTSDALRTLLLLGLTTVLLWAFYAKKIKNATLLAALALLILVDLIGVDKRYVNSDSFVDKRQMEKPFTPTPADQQIARDTARYRVFDLTANPFNSARASYFHNSIGGYHAAKPRRMQDLFDFYLSKNNLGVLNLLNVKYVLLQNQEGQVVASLNPGANGPVWLVDKIKWVDSEDEEILALDSLNTRKTAVVHSRFKSLIDPQVTPADSTVSIKLIAHKTDKLQYRSNTRGNVLALFSEAYYSQGWQAYIDGKPVPHFRADYWLRALVLPAGEHEVEFVFKPQVVQTGSRLALAGSFLFLILTLTMLYFNRKNKTTT